MKKTLLCLSIASSCLISAWCVNAQAAKKPLPKADTEQTEPPKDQFTDPNKMIQVTPAHPTFVLKIKSNPTTGYMWFLSSYDSDKLTPVSRKYIPSKSDLVGAGGYAEWTFKVDKKAFDVPQLAHINLEYVRPWVVSDSHQKLDFSIAIEPKITKKKA